MNRPVVVFVAALVVFTAATIGFANGGGAAGLLSDEEQLDFDFTASGSTEDLDVVEPSPEPTVVRSDGTDDTGDDTDSNNDDNATAAPTNSNGGTDEPTADNGTTSPSPPVNGGDANDTDSTDGINSTDGNDGTDDINSTDDTDSAEENVTDGVPGDSVTDGATTGTNSTDGNTTARTVPDGTGTASNGTVTGDTEGTVTDGTAIDASESVDGTDVERQHGDDAVSKNEMSADGYGNVSSVAEDDPVSNNTERTESDDDATQNTTVERTAMDSNGTDDTATDATGTDGTTGDSESTDSDDGGASDPRVAPTDESADTEQSEQKRDDSNASVAGSDAIGEEVPDGGTVSTAGGTEAVVEIYADSGTA